jgi:ABC-2 type transport system permease protein
MVLRIARKELTELMRDGRFRILSGIVLAVSLVALLAGWKHYSDLSRQHETAAAATREQWVNQPEKNPHSAAHYGVYAFKPKSQLAIVDTGIDPYMGVAVWLEAHRQNEFKYRPAQDRTAVQRFGEMTAGEVLQVLLPLFIVLMTFSAFSGEREQGTLRQLLSLGVRRRDLLVGKALGIGAGLGLVLVPSVVMGVVAMALSLEGGLLAGDPMRAVLLVGVYAAYFVVMIALSLGVSAWAQSSRLALVILLSFWFANSLIASRAVADLASALHPTPSAIEFQKAMQADLDDRAPVQQRLDERRAELFREYNVASVDALPIAFSGISLQEGEEYANLVFDRHYGRLFDLYERQNRVHQIAGVVAPMLAVRSLSMGLAGTDFLQHRDFIRAAEDYRRDIQRILNGDIVRNQKPGQVYLAGRALWEEVPAFTYEAPGTAWVLGAYTTSLLILAAWMLGGLAWMLRAGATARVD